MHKLNSFLKFVEIQTKVASFFPFITGTLMAVYLDFKLNLINLFLMFFALLMIDLTTTGLNHYMDYRRAVLKTGYHYQVHNPLGKGELSESEAKYSLIAMLVLGTLAGLGLVLRTDLWVLALGGLAFVIGVTYSFGPVPISRTVLGEAMSGIFMGGLIPFLSFYIHAFTASPLEVTLNDQTIALFINHELVVPALWIGLPLIALIANIMLANNLCDREEDFVNRRYTLPVTMGAEKAIILYQGLVAFAYLSVIAGVVFGILPITQLLVLLSLPLVYKNTKIFAQKQSKGETFVTAVKNFVMVALMNVVGLAIAILIYS